MLHSLFINVLQTIDHLKISYLEAPFLWLEKSRNHMGRDLDCMVDVLMEFHHPLFPSQTQNSIHILPYAISGLFHP
jgi:hypothetical protein